MAQTNNNLMHQYVLTELFKTTFLVDINETQESKSTHTLLEVIVFYQSETNSLPAAEQKLLEAILTACKLSSNQFQTFSHSALQTTALTTFLENHQPKKIILFGIDPATIGLPIHFPIFQIQAYEAIQYLHAPKLAALEADKQLKLELWQKLKQLFSI